MIDENIKDSDIVLVKQQKTAENKKGVFILLRDYEIKLKLFLKKQKRIKLQINKKMLARKRCPICRKKEDPDGRCGCTNKDAW